MTKIVRTATAPTNTTKYTWSAWVKKCGVGGGQTIVYNQYDGANRGYIAFDNDDKIFFYDRHSNSEQNNVYGTRRFRDPNAWYHIHVKADSTQANESDRFQVHINGVLETLSGSGSGTVISQNDTLGFKVATATNYHSIGENPDSTSNSFSGVMSHIHYVDGLALPYTDFGSFDSTTGNWKINTSPTVASYGNNGYFVLKDSNSVTDQSGEGHNFTVGNGTLSNTEDCPSNSFATFNPALVFRSPGHDLSRGNTQCTNSTGTWYWRPATLAASSGKFYCEVRISAVGVSINGVCDLDDCTGYSGVDTHFGKTATTPNGRGFAWYSDDGKIYYNNTSGSVISTYTTSDIIRMALDIDNGAFYIGKNSNSWLNGGDPTSGASRTGAVGTWTVGGMWTFANAVASSAVNQFNFGNGIFGQSTAVASAGTNASNNGIFEYDVPTGYTALSSKGLNL